MTTLYIDLETYSDRGSPADLGTYEYARTADVLLVAFAVDQGPVNVWDRTITRVGNMPSDLVDALEDETVTITAHNAQFDRAVLRADLVDRIGFRAHLAYPARWRCTMVKAMTHGFPGSLDAIGRILGLPGDKTKLADGKKLIHRFCKPAPANHKADRYTRDTHPEEWARFIDYAARDIDAMREIDRRLPDWNMCDEELALWRLDQTINDRGFAVDRELVNAGVKAAAAEKIRLAKRFVELTGGAVEKPTQREKFRQYLNARFGLSLINTQAQTLRDTMKGDIDPVARELMEVTLAANKTSLAKYGTLAPTTSPDGRFRGGLQFSGAARTRRWAGRTFQPHNLPSRGLPSAESTATYIRALKLGCHDYLFDDHMLYGSAALRGVVVAPEGKRLVCADLSNIEGRANAWLAGETWKLDAFRAFDRGEGPDLYNVTAGSLLGKAPDEVSKTDRNVMGKVPELALGYEGGFGAFMTFAKVYGVRMTDHWPTIQTNIDAEFVEKARFNRDTWGVKRDPDADRTEWIAAETVKLAWRARHPKISSLWRACSDAAKLAIGKPGAAFKAGPHLRFKLVRHHRCTYLLMRLPSGRFLCYFDPRVEDDGSLSFMGVHPITRQWTRLPTYGGRLVENACQSLSRDILASSMPAIEAEGFEIILTVHDETVTEAPDSDAYSDAYSADRLSKLMSTPPAWAEGFPLAAAGFVADRYRKG